MSPNSSKNLSHVVRKKRVEMSQRERDWRMRAQGAAAGVLIGYIVTMIGVVAGWI